MRGLTDGVQHQVDGGSPARGTRPRNKKVEWQLKWKERRLKRRERGKQADYKVKGDKGTERNAGIKSRGVTLAARPSRTQGNRRTERSHVSGTARGGKALAVGAKRLRDDYRPFKPEKKKKYTQKVLFIHYVACV